MYDVGHVKVGVTYHSSNLAESMKLSIACIDPVCGCPRGNVVEPNMEPTLIRRPAADA